MENSLNVDAANLYFFIFKHLFFSSFLSSHILPTHWLEIFDIISHIF